MRLGHITSGVWGSRVLIDTVHIVLAMKPVEGSFASNALEHGVSGLNIDGSRVDAAMRPLREVDAKETESNVFFGRMVDGSLKGGSKAAGMTSLGRFPPNVILDASQLVVGQFPETGKSTGGKGKGSGLIDNDSIYGKYSGENKGRNAGGLENSGSASRFFKHCEADNMKEDEDERENQ